MQGNHVILALPLEEQMTWLECTSQEVPFGYLGDFTDDRDVLVITENGGELKQTKKYGQKDNLEQLRADFQISAGGDVSGDISKSSAGIFYGDQLRLKHFDPKELNKHYLKKWGRINRLEIEDIVLKNNRDSVVFYEELKISATGYLTSVNNDYLLRPNLFGLTREYIPARYAHRKTPFALERGSMDEIEIHFTLPEGYEVSALPESTRIENEFGSYTSHFSAEGEQIKYTRTFRINEGTHDAGAYNEFRDFYKDVVRGDAQKLLIKTKS